MGEYNIVGDKYYQRKRYAEKKDQILEKQKIYLSKDETKSKRNAYYLNYNHGVTLDQYNDLLAKQNGVCAICQEECPTGRKLAVDHCHETNVIRGLLCIRCNNGIGQLRDSIKLLQRAIEYLQGANDE